MRILAAQYDAFVPQQWVQLLSFGTVPGVQTGLEEEN